MLPALAKSRQSFRARLIRCMLALAIHGLISSSVSAGRRFVPAALSLALAGCGGTPVSPESSLLPLTPGNYVLVGYAQPLSTCQGTGAISGRHTLVLHQLSAVRAQRGLPARRHPQTEMWSSGSRRRVRRCRLSHWRGQPGAPHEILRSVASLGVFSVAFSAQGGSGAADLQGGASTLPTPNAYLYVSGRVTVDGALGHGTCAQAFLAIRNPEACGADQTPC